MVLAKEKDVIAIKKQYATAEKNLEKEMHAVCKTNSQNVQDQYEKTRLRLLEEHKAEISLLHKRSDERLQDAREDSERRKRRLIDEHESAMHVWKQKLRQRDLEIQTLTGGARRTHPQCAHVCVCVSKSVSKTHGQQTMLEDVC